MRLERIGQIGDQQRALREANDNERAGSNAPHETRGTDHVRPFLKRIRRERISVSMFDAVPIRHVARRCTSHARCNLLLVSPRDPMFGAQYGSLKVSRARLAFRAAPSTLVVALALSTGTAGANPPVAATDRVEQAAAAFDAGVKAFEKDDFTLAARQFLRADAIVPNTDALYNAIAAAQRAKHDALLATAARRATSREASAPELAARAARTLADVERRVARLVLSCEPTDCELAIDGEEVPVGTSYALPGARLVAARWADGALAERRVETVAGSEQSVALVPESRPAAGGTAPAQLEPRSRPVREASTDESGRRTDRGRPFSPGVVYAGAGITLALAAATTWSGIDTLNAKARLPGTQSDNDAVLSRAHRTDALLLGTVVVGVATTAVGLAWTDWDGAGSRLALSGSFGERGAMLCITGTR